MPAKSPEQYGLMQAAAHGKARKGGPIQAVAKEFIDATMPADRKRFAKTLALRRKRRLIG